MTCVVQIALWCLDVAPCRRVTVSTAFCSASTFVGMHIKSGSRCIFACVGCLAFSVRLVNTVIQRCIKSANDIIFCTRCHFCHDGISGQLLSELDVL